MLAGGDFLLKIVAPDWELTGVRNGKVDGPPNDDVDRADHSASKQVPGVVLVARSTNAIAAALAYISHHLSCGSSNRYQDLCP